MFCWIITYKQNPKNPNPQIPYPPKSLREKLTPRNPVFPEKKALREMPLLKNRENKRKTTRGIMEQPVNRLKTACFNSSFIREGGQIGKK
jgi:hypothetical protein